MENTEEIEKSVWQSLSEEQKERRDRSVDQMYRWLDKHNIPYEETGLPHIVLVKGKLYVSLKKTYSIIRFRYAGKAKWYVGKHQTLLDKIAEL